MSVTVEIPTPMRAATGGAAAVSAHGGTIQAVLADLVKQFPEMGTKLFDAQGELRQHVNVFVNDEDIRYLDELETAVEPGRTVVALIPAVAGG